MSFIFQKVKGMFGYGEDKIKNFQMQAQFLRKNLITGKLTCEFIDCKVKFLQEKKFDTKLWIINESYKEDGNNEYLLPISVEMDMRYFFKEQIHYFLWDLDQSCELQIQTEENDQQENFKKILQQLIYENKFQKQFDQNNQNLLYIRTINDPSENIKKNDKQNKSKKESVESLNKKLKNLTIQEYPKLESNPEFDQSQILLKLAEDQNVIVVNTGAYFCQQNVNNKPQVLNTSIIFLVKKGQNQFEYFFQVLNNTMTILTQKQINSELSYIIDIQQNLIKWLDASKGLQIYGVLFDSIGIAVNYSFVMSKCLFESNRQEQLENAIQQNEQQEFQNQMAQQEIQYDENLINQHKDDIEQEFSSEDENDQIEEKQNKQETIKTIQQAKVLDRVFMSKGQKISVYRPNELQFDKVCDLPIVKNYEKENVITKKIQMHDQDTKLILLNENNDKKLYYLDLETGKIIDELYADGINCITDMAPEKKLDEFTHNPLLLAINSQNIFKLDPRINGKNKSVQEKIYKTNNNFTSITSNQDGNFALGSKNGDIRFYKEAGKNAKNLFQGWGEAIQHIECTKNGRWVLATCKNYLILLPTIHESLDCFSQQLSNPKVLFFNFQPVPRKLTILPEHMAQLNISNLNFTNAKFDSSENQEEKFITTSTGQYLVTWSLKNVIRGKIYDYEVKRINDTVIGSEFKFNQQDKLFVASNTDLFIKKLKEK